MSQHGRGPASSGREVLTVDLHPIFRDDRAIYRTVREAIFKASATGVRVVEIIPGKGSATLKKRVLAFLAQQHIKKLYARVEADTSNAGRVYVYMR